MRGRAGQPADPGPVARAVIAAIVAAKGGLVRDITAGDCLELAAAARSIEGKTRSTGMHFYQLLRTAGVLPPEAPASVRMFATRGQLTPDELIGQYGIECVPVRDLLVSYLRERQLAADYSTLRTIAHILGRLFWRDLELHHPGISSLRLSPAQVAGWKTGSPARRREGPRAGRNPPGPQRPTPCSQSARSTSTSPSGPSTTRPGGRSGRHRARSGQRRSRTRKSCPGARPGWTSGPANGSGPPRSRQVRRATGGMPRRNGSPHARQPSPARRSPPEGRNCAGRSWPRGKPPGPGPRTPPTAAAAT